MSDHGACQTPVEDLLRSYKEENARLHRCITMAMGCLDPESKNRDERLAWRRLFDAEAGLVEPSASLPDDPPMGYTPRLAGFEQDEDLPHPPQHREQP